MIIDCEDNYLFKKFTKHAQETAIQPKKLLISQAIIIQRSIWCKISIILQSLDGLFEALFHIFCAEYNGFAFALGFRWLWLEFWVPLFW